MTKKTEIEIEIEIEVSETVAYSSRNERFDAYCPQCASMVEMAKPPTAAALKQITQREIYRLVEANEIHFVEAEPVLICLRSLGETDQENKSRPDRSVDDGNSDPR